MRIAWLIAPLLCIAVLGAAPAHAQCTDQDGDGFGVGAGCQGPDVNDAASSCTTVSVDFDFDGVIDCLDRCNDADHDNFGINTSSQISGAGSIAIGSCTTNGVTQCSFGDAPCIGLDVLEGASSCTTTAIDADGDLVQDCLDRCSDPDRDDFGVNTSSTIVGGGSITVGGCTTNGFSACTFGDAACLGVDVLQSASSCTTSSIDADGDSVMDCLDRCLDADGDDYGTNNSTTVVGAGAIAVGACTTNGTTACTFGDAACIAADCDDGDPASTTCAACGALGISNGTSCPTSAHGASCSVECDPGFAYAGNDPTCANGAWSLSPTCEALPQVPATGPLGRIALATLLIATGALGFALRRAGRALYQA